MNRREYTLRTDVRPADIKSVEEIIRSTDFFREDEILVAIELIQEKIDQGEKCDYNFIFFDLRDKTVGYACYGLIPCSLVSYDLYWIATHQNYRGQGIGKIIMAETETRIAAAGGKTIYVETSSRELYIPTCSFYLHNGYILKARFEDFYDIGDDKLVFIKKL